MAEETKVAEHNVDELLAGLATMGFEFEECQHAVQAGKNTLESAIEWLIQNKTNLSSIVSEQVSSTQPTAQPADQSMDLHTAQGHTDELKPVTSSEAINVSSRFEPSEEQRKDKERYEHKEREAIRMEAKRRKVMDRKARQQILQHIAEDRQSVKSKVVPKTSTTASTDASPPASPQAQHSQCILQMRFPTGLLKKERFPADSKLQNVVTFVCQSYPIEPREVQLIQPFPRREFADLDATLAELGLIPGGSIVVQRKKVDLPHSSGHQADSPPVDCSSSGEVSSTDDTITDKPVNRDGSGEEEMEEEGGEVEEGGGGQEIGPGNIREFPDGPILDPGRIPNLAANPFHEELLGRQPGHVWGGGVKLGEVEHNPHALDPVPRAASAGESAMKRLERKQQQQRHQGAGPSDEGHVNQPKLHRDVERLENLCVHHVTQRLLGHHYPIMSLGGLPHPVCDKILAQLIKNKNLTPKTFHPFLTCCLKYVKLDCYLLVTNELLIALRLHKHLVHLSLRSCPLITDKALEAVAVLRRLKSLNLNQCSQLTDKSFVYIKDLPSLTTLQMDDTKITDKGLCLFLENSSCCGDLVHLSVSGTGITDQSLEAMTVLKSVKILGLENTKITSLEVVQHLSTLQSLNVSHTNISSLAPLQNHPALTSLSMFSTDVTDAGLRHLQGLQLSTIILPNRLTITDRGVTHIQGLPLVALDLSDYIHVTDSGIHHLKSLSCRLQRLSLSNTKLTDNGMMSIMSLVNVEELNLDRTAITDAGCAILSNLEKLQILSMSATRITNKFLIKGMLNSCTSLNRLNLSRTRLSNRGVRHLRLPSLSSLNLDWTRVTSDCQVLLTGCPNLKSLRTNNCNPPDVESPEESEEET